MRTPGRSLELFYIDGHADGMLTAELYNWTGHVLMAPRTQLADALKRPEPKCTGVYLLLGEQNGEPLAYIGESDDVGQRLKNHDLKKDWWTSVVFITTAGNKLNKAHARYLESRLIAEAKRIGRMPLDNATTPPIPSLSEADIAKMEAFLDNLLTVLPAVRVDMFIERRRPTATTAADQQHAELGDDANGFRFSLENRKNRIQATALLINGEFVVEAGSLARLQWESKSAHSYRLLHSELKRAGVLREDGVHCIFTQNYAFQSPSAAAAVVNGRPSNGTLDWHNLATRLPYKEWEARILRGSSPSAEEGAL